MSAASQSVWVVMCNDTAPDGDDHLVAVASTPDAAKREAADYVGEKSLTWFRLNSMFDSQDQWLAAWQEPDGSVLNFFVYEEGVVS